MARLADIFAGKGSFAEKLKKRREAIESGNPRGTNPRPGGYQPKMTYEVEDNGYKKKKNGS